MLPTKRYDELAPEAYKNLMNQYNYTRSCGLEVNLLLLVELRASQMNGCAFCTDMHFTEALERGEAARRLNSLNAWRELPWYTPRERAALAWTEILTSLPVLEISEDAVNEVYSRFSDKEVVDLTHAISLVNTWNRFGVAFRPAIPSLAK